jgi:ketosteroid isomerase-like protein
MPEHAEIVRRLFALFGEGAVEEILAYYHEDAVLEVGGDQGVVRGRDELVGYLRDAAASTRITETKSLRFEEDGDAVLVTGRLRLRDTGGSMSDSPGAWIFNFDGDQVIGVRSFRDPTSARDALAADG